MPHPCQSRSTGARAALARATVAAGAALVLAAAPSTAAPQARTTTNAAATTAAPADSLATVLLAASHAAASRRDIASPGDSLRLTIWREPDLSRSYWIDESGSVNLPKIGQVRAAGVPSDVLAQQIVAAYQAYLTHSAIDVTILHRVQIRGAVRIPGIYYVNQTMTLGDALALAGSNTPEGQANKVRLVRRGEPVSGRLLTGTRLGEVELRSGDEIYVPERSWASRNMGFLSTVLGASATILVAALYH